MNIKNFFNNLLIVVCFNLLNCKNFSLASKNQITLNINEKYVEHLLRNLNKTVDPCEDFYAFACGNWSANYALLPHEYVDMPGYMDYKVNAQLLKALQSHKSHNRKEKAAAAAGSIYEKLWQFYDSCRELQAPALNYFLRALEPELHMQWPIFRANWSEPWQNASNFDWLGTLGRLRKYGLNGVFIGQDINVRATNGSHYIIALQQHQSTLNVLHEATVTEIFVNFGMSPEESKNITIKLMSLENSLKNLTFLNESLSYNERFFELNVTQLLQQLPGIDWLHYLELLLTRRVSTNEMVQVIELNAQYINDLNVLLLQQTTNETIAYYLMLKLMLILNLELPLHNNSTMTCIAQLRGGMPLAVNYIYEEYYYKSKRLQTDASLLEIYKRLHDNFAHQLDLENNLNLSLSERAFIKKELNTMRLKIGNIPECLTQEFVDEFYAGIEMNATNFYANKLQILKFHTQREQLKLKNVAVPAHFHFYEHDAGTSSSSSPVKIFDNAILLPYGYLQLPFFVAELSALYQYSLLGFIMAHEIAHAFDMFHIVYDANGNYNETGIGIAQHFREFINCYMQQNEQSDILSEIMADVTGLRLAFDTYFHDVANELNELDLKTSSSSSSSLNENFSNEQLFFINSVQFLCANITSIKNLDLYDTNLEHGMHDVRVRKNWSNFDRFAESFKCKTGARMNPTKRCRLW